MIDDSPGSPDMDLWEASQRPEVCMYCETVPPQGDDIFCAPCRATVSAGMDKVTDPVELVLSAHWASVITQDDEERTLCRCGQTFVGGPAYHRRHIAIWIYRALGLKGPSPWELGPESGTRHHPDAEALGLLHNDGEEPVRCIYCGLWVDLEDGKNLVRMDADGWLMAAHPPCLKQHRPDAQIDGTGGEA